MLNKEYIEAILKLLNAENDTFDGNFYSFSYFPKNTKTEDIDYNAPRPTYTITGNETIKKYNDLYNGLYKSIVGKKRMTFKVFKDNTQNFIFENRFNEAEIKKFVEEKKEYITNDIYKIYGLDMEQNTVTYGKYTLVKKDYITTFLNDATKLKDTKFNELELNMLKADSAENQLNFVYIVTQHNTIDNLYSTQLMHEELPKIIYTLRFMSCIKWNRAYIDSIPFISYKMSHFQYIGDWMTSGHNFVRKDKAILIDNEWFNDEAKGHKRLWNLLDFESSRNELEERIMKSIEWVGKAYGEEDEGVALLEISFAFETLLKNDEKAIINPSIVASLSESYAFINGDNVDERISLESEFKKFYGERSGLVHGGKEKLTNASINPYEMITKTIRNVLINPKFCNCKNMSELALLFKQMKYSLSDDASKSE